MSSKFISSVKKELLDWRGYLMVLTGSVIASLGINLFLVPNKIAAGGVTGIATIIFYLLELPVGITMFCLNIPLFLIGIKVLGRSFGFKSFFATIVLSLLIDLTSGILNPVTNDLLLATIFGGLFTGIGIGLVLKQDASTGGTDLGAKIIHKIFPYFTVGQLLFVIDACIVFVAAIVFKNYELGLYAAITLFIVSRVIDTVIVGVNYTKAVHIISDNSEEISRKINSMNLGVTGLKGKGIYSGTDKNILLCIVRRRDLPHLKTAISQIDNKAFVFVTDVREVLGEGFSQHV